MNKVLAYRTWIPAACALAIGATLRVRLGWPADDPVLGLIQLYRPALYQTLYVTYCILLVTTPYWVCALIGSLAYIFIGNVRRRVTPGALPPYPAPAARAQLYVVLGEQPIPRSRSPWPHPRGSRFPNAACIPASR